MREIYVSPTGNDGAAGTREAPLLTLQRAIRNSNAQYWDGVTTIYLTGGVHQMSAPVRISGDAQLRITSVPGEQAILSGGRPLPRANESDWNGRRLWTVDLPDVKGGRWYFRSLFAGEARRPRAYLPREGFYWIEDVPGHTFRDPLFDGANCFVAKEGDMQSFRNLTDAEIHVFHYWVDEHMPIASYDPETREVVSTHQSVFALQDDQKPRFAKYRVENIFEGLLEPGDWYLDRTEGRLYYLPAEDETLDNTVLTAPVTEQLLIAENVSGLTIDHVNFEFTDWSIHQGIKQSFDRLDENTLYAAAPQAACNLPGVISFRNAKYCTLTSCEIKHVGLYAVDLVRSCRNMRLQGNTISDIGAGGFKLNGATAEEPLCERTQFVTVADNDIGLGGRVFLSGIGVCSMHANHIRIAHNHIHDLYYSGVSCGWVWGYSPSSSFDNIIEYNHIHKLGHGVLSDMGGIYTLSVQPGTVLRNNLIHDIEKANYGGWAIYPDEGSSHILIENNICYDTSSSVFHQHYGRENVVRNNIWAFGREGMVTYTRAESHSGYTFERNIVLADDQPIYTGRGTGNVHADMNLFWDISGKPLVWGQDFRDPESYRPLETLASLGYDLHSTVADPCFTDAAARDFTLLPDSPALAMGFRPIDMSRVGVRAEADWD